MRNEHANADDMPRRDFLDTAAKASLIGVGAMTFIGVIQLPLPKVLNEPSGTFKIGFPGDFTLNSFATVPERNVFVVRDASGFRAMSAICTHLGCIVSRTEWGFMCPCHGSEFDGVGKPVSGPAPKPLDWFRVSLAPDGQLQVDSKKKVGRDHVLVV